MIIFIVFLLSVVTLGIAFKRGPATAFNWVFLPVFLLTPLDLWIHLPALPELNARRAIALCILIAMIARGKGEMSVPQRSSVDRLMLLAMVAWSLSYGVHTDVMGFVHSMAALSVDLWLPFILARRLWRGWDDLAKALIPIGFATLILALLAMYEARMISRSYARLWDDLTGTGVLPYFEMWRWGFLRAGVVFNHPITLGVSFAMLAPLALLWGMLVPRWRRLSKFTAAACVIGAVATISRGPIIAALLGLCVVWFMHKERRYIYPLIAVLVVAAIPYLYGLLQDSMAYVEASLAEQGNVESGYYRIALFMIYLEAIRAGGLFGNPASIGQEYEAAWSIDNSYIYMFLTYGWLGGAVFTLLVVSMIWLAVGQTRRLQGEERIRMACLSGAAVALAFAILNVWFSGDYSPLLFMLLAVIVNQTLPRTASPKSVNQERVASGTAIAKGTRAARWRASRMTPRRIRSGGSSSRRP